MDPWLVLLLLLAIALRPTHASDDFSVARPSTQTMKMQELEPVYYVIGRNPLVMTCTLVGARPATTILQCAGASPRYPDGDQPSRADEASKIYSYEFSFRNSVIKDLIQTTEGDVSCKCNAFDKTGNEYLSKQPAIIREAFLEKSFFEYPRPAEILIGKDAALECAPPLGEPAPYVWWERNGKRIDASAHDKYQHSPDGSLTIHDFALLDAGNYTCVASNVADTVRSASARIDISYLHMWSDWQGWGKCDNPCGDGVRIRMRQCINKDLNQPGDKCFGLPVEERPCVGPCIDDTGNKWPANPGSGSKDSGSTFILEDVKSSNTGRQSGVSDDQAILIGVVVSVIIFVLASLVVVFFLYRKSRSVGLHKAYPAMYNQGGVYSPNNVVVSKHGEAEILASMASCNQSLLSGYNQQSQQVYFVDPKQQPRQSYLPGSPPEQLPMLLKQQQPPPPNPDPSYASIPNDSVYNEPLLNNNSPVSKKKYERLSTSSAEAEDAVDGGRSLIASKRFYEEQSDVLRSVSDDKFVVAKFTHAGGRLCLPRSGVSLLIPEGAVPPNTAQEVYLAISNEDRERPKLPEGGTILSPIITCGPAESEFLRPVVLSFAHSALNPTSDWTISVLGGSTTSVAHWQCLLLLGEETPESPGYCQIDQDRCHLLLDSLHDKYCLVGKSANQKRAVKKMILAAFAPAALRLAEYSVRIYCVEDTQDALENVISEEKKSGGVMMDCCKLMHFRDTSEGGLHLALTNLSAGWRCKLSTNQQTVPFHHIWCAVQSSLHASFSLEQPDRTKHLLETNIEAFQFGSHDVHLFTIKLSMKEPCPMRQSLVDITPTGVYDPPGLVFRLPHHVRAAMCQALDPTVYTRNDWRMLARTLNVDRYINYFASKSSPTSHILDLWEARNRQDSAVRELICAVRSMGRSDLSSFIEAELGHRTI